MTRILRILAAVLLLAALTGAESCERPVGGGVQSDRPAWERKCEGPDCRTADITAAGSGFYEVHIIAHDLDVAGIDRFGPEPFTPGYRFTANIRYETGARIEILVRVTSPASDLVECAIVDGQNSERQGAAGQVLCKLTTSQ